jgi:hypothetical protein
MRTYDPADGIRYVHLAQDPAAPAAAPRDRDECHRLPPGYATDVSLRPRSGGPGVRPALVLLPGGSAAADDDAAAPDLRVAR